MKGSGESILHKVKENLSQAIEVFKECGADGWIEKYEKELSEITPGFVLAFFHGVLICIKDKNGFFKHSQENLL